MKSQDETLEDWCRALLQALELEDVEMDINEVLALAGVAAHSVVRPAAPLTTFIAGFAAGLASGSGQATGRRRHAGRHGRGAPARQGLRRPPKLPGHDTCAPRRRRSRFAARRRSYGDTWHSPATDADGRHAGQPEPARRTPGGQDAGAPATAPAPGPHLAGGPAARL